MANVKLFWDRNGFTHYLVSLPLKLCIQLVIIGLQLRLELENVASAIASRPHPGGLLTESERLVYRSRPVEALLGPEQFVSDNLLLSFGPASRLSKWVISRNLPLVLRS